LQKTSAALVTIIGNSVKSQDFTALIGKVRTRDSET